MLRELEKIIANNSQKISEQELKMAAAKLREKQFIFKDRRGQARTFDVLVNQKDYFENLFDAFGDEFFVDQHFGYCGILPSNPRPMLKQLDTIFLLLLVKMHDLECRKARSEHGKTQPNEALLLDEYCAATAREKPKQADARAALERLARLNVIELGAMNEQTEMREITILPSIMRIVTGSYLESLTAFCVSDQKEAEPLLDADEEEYDEAPQAAVSIEDAENQGAAQ
jgi:hypothetical protein